MFVTAARNVPFPRQARRLTCRTKSAVAVTLASAHHGIERLAVRAVCRGLLARIRRRVAEGRRSASGRGTSSCGRRTRGRGWHARRRCCRVSSRCRCGRTVAWRRGTVARCGCTVTGRGAIAGRRGTVARCRGTVAGGSPITRRRSTIAGGRCSVRRCWVSRSRTLAVDNLFPYHHRRWRNHLNNGGATVVALADHLTLHSALHTALFHRADRSTDESALDSSTAAAHQAADGGSFKSTKALQFSESTKQQSYRLSAPVLFPAGPSVC